jgi:MFS family permease
MSDRLGQRAPMVATLAVGIVGVAVTLPSGCPLWLFALGYGAFIAAYWGYLPPASAEVSARSSHHDRQPALLAFYAAMWLGAAVAPAAGSLLSSWTQAVAAVLAAWAISAVVAALTFTRSPAEQQR